MTARGDMRNRNPVHWNWGWCSPIPRTLISPSDCDCEWERNYRFLRVECKHPGEELSQGELIKLTHFSLLRSPDGQKQVVLVLFGNAETSTPVGYRAIIGGVLRPYKEIDRAWFVDFLHNQWFPWADKQMQTPFWLYFKRDSQAA